MRIIKPTDSIPVDHPVFLIVALIGTGKSSIGSSFNTLLLDFDHGAHRAVNRRDVAQIDAWRDVDLSRAALSRYSGVTIDTAERCLGMMTAAIIEENPKHGFNGVLTSKGWGVLKQRFGSMFDTLQSYGLDVLLLAHAKEVRDGDVRQIRADIPGGSYGEVLKRADFVGYLSIQGGRRMLDFNPTDKFIGKNPAGWAPIVVPPAEHAQSFMAELFEEGRQALGRKSEASARIAAAVERWQAEIATFRTAEQFTAGYERLRALKATDLAVYTQAYHVLSVAAKTAGMRFAADAGGFVDTGVRPPAPSRPSVEASFSRRAATVQPALYSQLTAGVQ